MVKAKNHNNHRKNVEIENDASSSSSSSSLSSSPDTKTNDMSADSNTQVFSRLEAKARKQILKHGLKQVPGVVRVTLSRPKNILILICNPDVYKHPNSNTYIVFGQVKVEDISSQEQLNAAQQLADSTIQNTKESIVSCTAANIKETPYIEEVVDLDETGLQPKDIELVMDQTKVSRPRAIKALKENNGDIVNAIMSIAI
ncbi:hypothetical protein T552_02411 [Pneumocystis carinii B80]|uniref:Nascent polypeptide-associated complex subunit alpha n=1 Tax=Pneumocystis carinii (strain B80) TaxID=1408658 RepID=A0A0W4ZGF2_PNEC8|nr:hypothetical protein T552_02411 [Pneumocystis carinii B80]KTW27433.1 hypothetical protein T552_02411 [Pneumocystis carinii B80]